MGLLTYFYSYFYSNPLLAYGAVFLIILLAYRALAPRVRITVPGVGLTLDDVVGKFLGPRYKDAKLEQAVKRFKKEGHHLGAGKLYEDAGKLPQAAEAYLEGSESFAAATIFERLGKGERAAELYLQAGDHKKAAQVLIDAGKPAKAAALFLEKGNTLEAARLYGLAQQWPKAGELYSKAGYPLRAAEAFEKQGEFVKAAESYEKHFMENVSYGTTYSATAQSADQKSALLAGRLYQKAGDHVRAREVFGKGGYFKDAASACMALKDYRKAAELYLRADDADSAAVAYDHAGDPVQAANLRGELALKADRPAEAAAFFQAGADYLRAAELYESQGLLKQAASAFEAGESWAAAGGVYVRAGLKERAGASYERAGDLETAAKLYEEAGNSQKAMDLYARSGQTFKSGEAAALAGEREKAIALLQRVSPGDDNYRAATELLAQLFIDSHMPLLALERLQKVIAGQPISSATLDLYYWLALAQEVAAQRDEALANYKRIQSEDLRFRDVERRVAALAAGTPLPLPTLAIAARPESTAAPAAPLPSAPEAPTPAAAASTPATAPSAPAPPDPSVAAPTAPRPSPPAAPPAGKGSRFAIREPLGEGTLGKVFRAEDQSDGRSVALRLLPAEVLTGERLPALVADLKLAAQVSHPNLVKLLGFIEHEGQRALVTEYVAGKNLSEALKAGRKMAFQQVHTLGRVLAQVLSLLHSKGVAHGSLKPSNIMVAAGVLKLADVGLGRLAQLDKTPAGYGPPEGGLDAAADLYALAAVLYHLLTGAHPKSQSQGAALPLPSTLATGVPEAFDKLLIRCLHPRRELRFASAEDILAELKQMVKIG